MERKVGSGRKGTVDEEEYLLKSVTKLVDRFLMTQGSVITRARFFNDADQFSCFD
jgi:hypothetical protein